MSDLPQPGARGPDGPAEPDRDGVSPPAARSRRRWPWWLLGGLVVLTVAAGIVVARAPGYVRGRIEARLGERFGAAAQVDEVEIHWSRLTIEAIGVRFDDGERIEVDIERLEIDLALSNLVRGAPRPRVVVVRPVMSFEATPATPREPDEQDLGAFEAIEIVDGSLEVMLPTSRGPAFVDMHQITARIDNRRTGGATPTLDLGIRARAVLGEAGILEIEGRLSSRAPAKAWSMSFELQRFELSTLNQLWLDLVEMDVERGFLSLDGELRRTESRLSGRVRPRFEEIALLGADEDALHPMAEALFGHMLMGARSTVPIDRPMTGNESSLPELLETDWRTLVQTVIKQGYARRLSTLRGFTATIGDVRVDLGQGLLQLLDVVVDTESPLVDVPLVTIDKVDVVFDPSVTQAGAPAYKYVTLWRPRLTFVTGAAGTDNRLQLDETWIDTISAIPFPTRDLVVRDGKLEVLDLRLEPPRVMVVTEIELRGHEMARELHLPGVRGAELSATGTVLGESQASVRVVYEPRAAVPNLDMDLQLPPIELTTLAPALQVYAGVDAASGSVGLSAHLSARRRQVEASVIPDVQRPKLLSMGRGHTLRKIVIGRALRRLRSRVIELRYEQGPDEGLLQEFFPQLIEAVFLNR